MYSIYRRYWLGAGWAGSRVYGGTGRCWVRVGHATYPTRRAARAAMVAHPYYAHHPRRGCWRVGKV
jgi:hypothetical protein